ncbi:MAG: type I-C CRISPR-associated protein Cas7/Csd2 [Rhodobacterales bacterium]|nr:MAG: type I-C CRISPR-associated protein Cas7/Csd2 [Rhodobacterales bacterium]
MTALQNRYDFVLFFDVANGNPNGDPDAGNLPRMDPETSQGLVSDVALKRKIRNYVNMMGGDGNEIFIREREPLNLKIAKACEVKHLPTFAKKNGGWETKLAKARSQEDIRLLQEWMCAQYFDIRTFGAVLSTGPNAGQVRGPVQFTFARSEEPILPIENTITRVADTDKEEGEMGRKHIVPYGLYRAHGFINAKLAEKTGFSESDLDTLWTALRDMFDLDRSAARGEMAARRLIAFKHDSALGNAQAHKLFDRVTVSRVSGGDTIPVGDPRIHNLPPARAFSDYRIELDDRALPDGITIVEPF